jgi:hypothetical protein
MNASAQPRAFEWVIFHHPLMNNAVQPVHVIARFFTIDTTLCGCSLIGQGMLEQIACPH